MLNWKFHLVVLQTTSKNATVPNYVAHVQHDYFSSFNQSVHCFLAFFFAVAVVLVKLATFGLQYEDDYEYEFSVLSMRFRFGGRKLWKCACSELKTRTRSRPRTQIRRSLVESFRF